MCWKCCLCLCCCSVDEGTARNREIDRMLNADQARLRERGVRSVEEKNWSPFTLGTKTYFIHGSATAPRIIKEGGGLDPSFGREEIRVIGRPPGKYLLAFKCEGNVVPDTVKLKGAAKTLWGSEEFKYFYIFHVKAGTTAFQSAVQSETGTQTEARESAETGLADIVPWSDIDRVFQYDKDNNGYVRNPIV